MEDVAKRLSLLRVHLSVITLSLMGVRPVSVALALEEVKYALKWWHRACTLAIAACQLALFLAIYSRCGGPIAIAMSVGLVLLRNSGPLFCRMAGSLFVGEDALREFVETVSVGRGPRFDTVFWVWWFHYARYLHTLTPRSEAGADTTDIIMDMFARAVAM